MAKKLSELPDGTGVRFNYLQSSGFQFVTEVQDGQVIGPNGDKRRPNGVARDVDKIVRGEDSRPSDTGWSTSEYWECFTKNGWEEIHSDR
jgi:hypothetical protein